MSAYNQHTAFGQEFSERRTYPTAQAASRSAVDWSAADLQAPEHGHNFDGSQIAATDEHHPTGA